MEKSAKTSTWKMTPLVHEVFFGVALRERQKFITALCKQLQRITITEVTDGKQTKNRNSSQPIAAWSYNMSKGITSFLVKTYRRIKAGGNAVLR